MIGEKAARGLTLASGIHDVKEGGGEASLWYGIVARILVDLDEDGNQDGAATVAGLLAGLWDALGEAPGSPGGLLRAAPTGNEVADVLTGELARGFAASGMSNESALRNAERVRRVYRRAYERDDQAREVPLELTPAQRYENACARFSEAAAALARVREAVSRMSEEAESEYRESRARLREFEKSPGIPKDEYNEGAVDVA